jgi:hypothetical protein
MTREDVEKKIKINLETISYAEAGDTSDELYNIMQAIDLYTSDLQKENEYQANNVKLAKSLIATLQTNNNELKQRIEELENAIRESIQMTVKNIPEIAKLLTPQGDKKQ